jgi:hypothetical protein
LALLANGAPARAPIQNNNVHWLRRPRPRSTNWSAVRSRYRGQRSATS